MRLHRRWGFVVLAFILGAPTVRAQSCVDDDNQAPIIEITAPQTNHLSSAHLRRLGGTIRENSGRIKSFDLQVGLGEMLDLTHHLLRDGNDAQLFHFAVTDIDLSQGTAEITLRATDFACTANSTIEHLALTVTPPASTLNLFALGLEVTQAIQGTADGDGLQKRAVARSASALPSLPYDGTTLIENKRTIVRAYAVAESSDSPLRGVPAKLTIRRGDQTVDLFDAAATLDPAHDVRSNGVLDADETLFALRGDATSSWNFVLPYSVTGAGEIDSITLSVNPADLAGPSECAGCNDAANQLQVTGVPFSSSRTLFVRPVTFTYDPAGDSLPLVPREGAALDVFCDSFFRGLPVADGCGLGLGIELLPAREQSMAALGLVDRADDITAVQSAVCQLMAIDRSAEPTVLAPVTAYYGIVPDGIAGLVPDVFGGAVDGEPHSKPCVAGVESAPAAKVAQEVGHGFLHADIAALGHSAWHACGGSTALQLPQFPAYRDPLGSPLPQASIGQFGFDTWDASVFPPQTSIDFTGFGYCPGDAWISPYTWDLLAQRLRVAPAKSEDEPRGPRSGMNLAYAISGVVRADGTIDLAPLYALPRPDVLTQPPPGALILLLRNSAGVPLYAASFGLTLHAELPAGGDFYFAVPAIDGVTRVDIQRGADMLLTRIASPHAPEVTLLHPVGGEHWRRDEVQTIEWTASDADGDALQYLVQYSGDGGTTWETLATGLRDAQLSVHTNEIPASDSALIRVLASDGMNSHSAQSGAVFKVAAKDPQLRVTVPGGTPIIESDGRLALLAGYLTLGDSAATADSIEWSNGGTILARGPRLDLAGSQLNAGQRLIDVSAPGRTTPVTQSITILRAPRLAELRPVGELCIGDCDGDGATTVDEIITGVNIALGVAPVERCPAFDASNDLQVTVDEILQGVSNALLGCH